jgi:hypothetical protein
MQFLTNLYLLNVKICFLMYFPNRNFEKQFRLHQKEGGIGIPSLATQGILFD